MRISSPPKDSEKQICPACRRKSLTCYHTSADLRHNECPCGYSEDITRYPLKVERHYRRRKGFLGFLSMLIGK